MSLLTVKSLQDKLSYDIKQALSIDTVYFNPIDVPTTPYAYVTLEEVAMEDDGSAIVLQTYRHSIHIVDTWPENTNLEDAKTDRANNLITRLMQRGEYIPGTFNPLVEAVGFHAGEDPDNRRYVTTIVFSVQRHVERLVTP